MAIHHAQETGDVVRQFGAASVADRIEMGKQISEIDSRANGANRGESTGEDFAILIGRRVVRNEKRSTVEKKTACSIATTNHAHRIRGMAELRPHLRQIPGPLRDVAQCSGRGHVERSRIKPPAPLLSIGCPGLSAGEIEESHVLTVRFRNAICLEPDDGIGAGVLHAGHKKCLFGNRDTSRCHDCPHARIVGHDRKSPGIRPAPAATASTAIVSALVRIIQTRRTVANDGDDSRKPALETNVIEHTLDDASHLIHVKPRMRSIGKRVCFQSFQLQPSRNLTSRNCRHTLAKTCCQPWKYNACDQRNRSDCAAKNSKKPPAKKCSAAARHASGELPQSAANRLP